LYDITSEKVRKARKRLFLLDYDGTLVDISPEISGGCPPATLIELLDKLNGVRGLEIVIITGRSVASIEDQVGALNINIIAEHGGMFREGRIWKTLADDDLKWKSKVRPVLERYLYDNPGSIIENKGFSIAWHYRNMNDFDGERISRALINDLLEFSVSYELNIIDGKKVVEVLSSKIGKGFAAQYLIRNGTYDYILSIGDDKTDENMFEALSTVERADTVKVGEGKTSARYVLSDVGEVKLYLSAILREMENN